MIIPPPPPSTVIGEKEKEDKQFNIIIGVVMYVLIQIL